MDEQDIRRIRTCERCKSTVPLDGVRLYPKTHDQYMLVCERCCNELKGISKGKIPGAKERPPIIKEALKEKMPFVQAQKKPEIQERPAIIPRTIPITRANDNPEGDTKISYLCERCNYHFKVKESKIGMMQSGCPYCGKADKLKREG